jgi:YD repeat-containing protein
MSGSSATSGLGWIFGGKVSTNNFSAGQNLSGKFISPVFLSEIRTASELIKFNRSKATTLKYNYDYVHQYLYLAAQKYDQYVFIPIYDGQSPIIVNYQNNSKIIDYNILKTYKLDEISVKSLHSNKTVKKYLFGYREGTNIRLQIMSVTEHNNGKNLPATTFEYNNTQLPGYLDIRADHWGYHNNRMAQVDYTSTSSMTNYYNLREPDPNYTKAGILGKINYPTGGSKEIRYEANKYNQVIKRNTSTGALSIQSCPEKIGGGLRVKEMIEFDGTNYYSKQYSYSSGILNGEIQYYWNNYQGKLLNGNTYTAQRFLTTSLLPVSNNSEGGSVSYSSVTERSVGNGRTEYKFSNHDNSLDENSVSIDLQKSPYSPLSCKVIERGKLLESNIYKEGATSPILRETYTYSVLNNNPEYIRSVYLRRLALFNAYEINAIEGSAYKVYTYPYNITKKIEYFYDNVGNTLKNEYSWIYDSHNQIANYTNQNNGNNNKTEFKYPYNYSDAIYVLMTKKNMISPVIEKISTVRNEIEIERIKTNYTNNYQITGGLILPHSVQLSFSGINNLLVTNTFNKYDTTGNLIQTTDKEDMVTCYIWGYGGKYIVAEIKNATITQIKSIFGLNNIEQSPLLAGLDVNQSNALREIDNALVTVYAIDPLIGILTKTDPKGFALQYNYDDFGRLKEVYYREGSEKKIIESYDYHYKNQ